MKYNTCIMTAIAIFKWQMACLNKRLGAPAGGRSIVRWSDLGPQVLCSPPIIALPINYL